MNNEYKEKLVSFWSDNKRMPAYSEMMRMFGFKSKNAVYKLVQKFCDAGLLRKDTEGKIVPTALFSEVPVLGLVKAGFPADTEEQVGSTLSLEDFLIEKKEASYILEVDGDSMIEAHIAEGDMVIVERANQAKDGDIVIAEVDGEWTMKYFRQKNGKTWLEPANKKYKPIYPERSLRVAAIVRSVIRKY